MFGLPGKRDASPCGRVREWLPEYDYGGPGWWRRRHVSRHLARCAGCARELQALRRAAEMLGALPETPAPAAMWERLEIAMEISERTPAAPRRVPALAAAAAVLAVALGLGLRPAPPPGEPPAQTAAYVRSHLALSHSQPLSSGAGLDALVLLTSTGSRQ